MYGNRYSTDRGSSPFIGWAIALFCLLFGFQSVKAEFETTDSVNLSYILAGIGGIEDDTGQLTLDMIEVKEYLYNSQNFLDSIDQNIASLSLSFSTEDLELLMDDLKTQNHIDLETLDGSARDILAVLEAYKDANHEDLQLLIDASGGASNMLVQVTNILATIDQGQTNWLRLINDALRNNGGDQTTEWLNILNGNIVSQTATLRDRMDKLSNVIVRLISTNELLNTQTTGSIWNSSRSITSVVAKAYDFEHDDTELEPDTTEPDELPTFVQIEAEPYETFYNESTQIGVDLQLEADSKKADLDEDIDDIGALLPSVIQDVIDTINGFFISIGKSQTKTISFVNRTVTLDWNCHLMNDGSTTVILRAAVYIVLWLVMALSVLSLLDTLRGH